MDRCGQGSRTSVCSRWSRRSSRPGSSRPRGPGGDLTGTPQAGILSPLLANIALSALDEHFTRQWQRRWAPHGSGPSAADKGWATGGSSATRTILSSWSTAPAHAEALREEVAAVLAPLGLRLARRKPAWSTSTRASTSSAFTSAGCANGGRQAVRLHFPSRKAIQSIKDKSQSRRTGQPGTWTRMCSPEHQPDAGGMGELPPSRSLQGRVQRDRPSCMGPDHALAKAEIQTRELPPRNASNAPPLLRRGTGGSRQRSQVHRRVSRAGHSLPLPRQQHTDTVGTPAGPANQLTPAGKTRGAPGAVRVARRVRRAGRGNPPGAILAGRPGPTQLLHDPGG